MASTATEGVEERSAAAAASVGSGWSESSHCHHWLFSSPEQLQRQRQLHLSAYLQQQQRLVEEQPQSQAEDGLSAEPADGRRPPSPSPSPSPSAPPPSASTSTSASGAVVGRRKERRVAASVCLSLSEQGVLVLYYQLMVGSLSARFSPPLPTAVQCTAQLYLHRFYSRHSPQSFHPKQVVLTALLLACKVEEHFISPARIAEKAIRGEGKAAVGQAQAEQRRVEAKVLEVVRLEVPLLEGLGFHLRCWHPHRAVRALVRGGAEREKWTAQQRTEVEERSLALIAAAYLTDAVLLHSPSHLALAAVSLAVEQLQLPPSAVQSIRAVAFPSSPPPPSVLHTRLSSVRAFMLAGVGVVAADVRREAALIDAKLMKCRDRSNDPTSDEWKERERKRAEEKERRREEKGKKRAEEERKRLQQLILGPAGEGRGGAGGSEAVDDADDDDVEAFIIKRRRVDDSQ